MKVNKIVKGTELHIEFIEDNEVMETHTTEATLITVFKNKVTNKLSTAVDGGGSDVILIS